MDLKPLSEQPPGLIPVEHCDHQLLSAIHGALKAAGPIVIPFRTEACQVPVRYVPPGGGYTMDPEDWTVTRDEAAFVVTGCYNADGEYSFVDNHGAYELHGRGRARVDTNGTVWRYLPPPEQPGKTSEKCNASCFGTRPPAPDARSADVLLDLFIDTQAEGAPWGWYEVGKVGGTLTAYPNAPIFPHGILSAKPDAPTKWGIVLAPASTDGT